MVGPAPPCSCASPARRCFRALCGPSRSSRARTIRTSSVAHVTSASARRRASVGHRIRVPHARRELRHAATSAVGTRRSVPTMAPPVCVGVRIPAVMHVARRTKFAVARHPDRSRRPVPPTRVRPAGHQLIARPGGMRATARSYAAARVAERTRAALPPPVAPPHRPAFPAHAGSVRDVSGSAARRASTARRASRSARCRRGAMVRVTTSQGRSPASIRPRALRIAARRTSTVRSEEMQAPSPTIVVSTRTRPSAMVRSGR